MAAPLKPRPAWLVEKIASLDLRVLQSRAKEDEMGCWLWVNRRVDGRCVLPLTHGRANVYRMDAKRLAYELANDEIAPTRMACRCPEHDLCIKPSHMRLFQPTQSLERRRKQGLAIAKARRARSAYSDELVADIRLSGESIYKIAERTGMSPSMAACIRSGKSRRDLRSPFAGIGQGWRG